MKNKYKIEIDPKAPSEDEIAQSMDFSKLMKDAQQVYNPMKMRKQMHKKPWFIMLIVCAVAIGVAMLLTENS
jgi:hypothetical protein